MKASELIIGKSYHKDSHMGGVFTMCYIGLTPDGFKHMFKFTDWFASQFSKPWVFYNDSQVEDYVLPITRFSPEY